MAFEILKIAARRELTPDATVLTFDRSFDFVPGQYLTLKRGDVRRSYSICSGPGEPLSVGIRRVEDGAFSDGILRELAEGAEIEVMPPQGRFTCAAQEGAKVLLIAAGSGITPMMSIAKALLEGTSTGEVTLVYGNRDLTHIMFREELDALKDRFLGRLSVIHVLSREPQEIDLANGRIDGEKVRLLAERGLIEREAEVYLCGPGGMIKSVEGALAELGVPRERIHHELFTPEGGFVLPKTRKPTTTEGVPVEVMLDGTRRRFSAKGDSETVLEAASRAGLELPYSCAGGMCCTCRAKVVEGRAEMDANYSLEPWELEAGFTLACQARVKDGPLVLDFDAS